jgi:hypothetical protein
MVCLNILFLKRSYCQVSNRLNAFNGLVFH